MYVLDYGVMYVLLYVLSILSFAFHEEMLFWRLFLASYITMGCTVENFLLTSCSMQVFGQEVVYYFHDMIAEFIKWGYQEGKTLFGFGYDFRQSNRYLLV